MREGQVDLQRHESHSPASELEALVWFQAGFHNFHAVLRLRLLLGTRVMSAPRQNETRKGSMMTGRLVELGRFSIARLRFSR